jgi:hypothetical protein
MRLAQLIGIRDQDTVPLGENRIPFVPIGRESLIAIQQEAQTAERLLPNGWTIERDKMGMHSGKIGQQHLK